jgi:hypothetical protein
MILKDMEGKDMNNDKYNGWTNRETWLVNLHFEPVSKSDLYWIKDTLEQQVEKINEIWCGRFFSDFIDLGKINWYELENHVEENCDDACEAE